MKKNLAIIIKATQDFVRHTESDINTNKPVLNNLFENISKVYLPLLNMLDQLKLESVQAKIGFVMPPILCNLLADESIQDLYLNWLDERNELGKKELERNSSVPQVVKQIEETIENNLKLKRLFEETYKKNLVNAFAEKVSAGRIELIGTTGTDIFIPHYADLREVICAQIESGLHSYRQFFGEIPEGFWLPELGYIPGVEKLIKAYGYSYTVLDSRAFLLAEKLPSNGTFYPSRTDNSLVVFANDSDLRDEVFGEEGYSEAEVYRNENHDIGFELTLEQLEPLLKEGISRFSTGYKYWNKDYSDSNDNYYDVAEAKNQALKDAEAFVKIRNDKLSKAAELISEDFVTIVCSMNADDLKDWNEGMFWLENVLRNAAKSEVSVEFCKNMIAKQYELEKITPYYSAGNGTGYGENLLSSKNSFMMRYIRKACERMIDLSDRFPNDTGLKTRLLNLGAKELMVAQSLNLAKMLENETNSDFAMTRFKESIEAFTIVFDSLGSNTVSTEWLTTLEMKDTFFPWMNYRIFTKKR